MNKKILIFILSIMILSGLTNVSAYFAEKELNELSNKMLAKLNKSGIKKIAFLEIVNSKGDLPNMGDYLKTNLYDLFYESKDINIMLDHDIKDQLKEQKMSSGSSIDEKFIIDILGVEAVIKGIITDFPDKLKLNIRITLKSGKVLAVYSSNIMKNEKNKPLMERIIMGEAERESNNSSSNIFLNENYNTYKPNTVPEDIGYGFVILQVNNKNFLSSNQLYERDLTWKIYFPDNFTFSFNFLPVSKESRLDCSIIFVDENKKEFISKLRAGSGQAEYILIPNSSKATVYFSSTKLNNIKIYKKKDIYKIYLNDKQTNFGIFTSFKRFMKVIIRTDFSQGKFTDFLGVDLGR